jgi:hypothetical protein
MDAFKLILVSLAGWMNRQQQHVIEYLQEEVRILKEQQGSRRPKFTDEQRRRLAGKAKLIVTIQVSKSSFSAFSVSESVSWSIS